MNFTGQYLTRLVLVVVLRALRLFCSSFMCGAFVSFAPWFGASCWTTQAEMWEVRVVDMQRLNIGRVYHP